MPDSLLTNLKSGGPWAVLAGVLLWFVLHTLTTKLDAQTTAIDAHRAEFAAHAKEMSTRIVESRESDRRREKLLEGICRGVNRGNPQAEYLCGGSDR